LKIKTKIESYREIFLQDVQGVADMGTAREVMNVMWSRRIGTGTQFKMNPSRGTITRGNGTKKRDESP
jgi:hypothetical protein